MEHKFLCVSSSGTSIFVNVLFLWSLDYCHTIGQRWLTVNWQSQSQDFETTFFMSIFFNKRNKIGNACYCYIVEFDTNWVYELNWETNKRAKKKNQSINKLSRIFYQLSQEYTHYWFYVYLPMKVQSVLLGALLLVVTGAERKNNAVERDSRRSVSSKEFKQKNQRRRNLKGKKHSYW